MILILPLKCVRLFLSPWGVGNLFTGRGITLHWFWRTVWRLGNPDPSAEPLNQDEVESEVWRCVSLAHLPSRLFPVTALLPVDREWLTPPRQIVLAPGLCAHPTLKLAPCPLTGLRMCEWSLLKFSSSAGQYLVHSLAVFFFSDNQITMCDSLISVQIWCANPKCIK